MLAAKKKKKKNQNVLLAEAFYQTIGVQVKMKANLYLFQSKKDNKFKLEMGGFKFDSFIIRNQNK